MNNSKKIVNMPVPIDICGSCGSGLVWAKWQGVETLNIPILENCETCYFCAVKICPNCDTSYKVKCIGFMNKVNRFFCEECHKKYTIEIDTITENTKNYLELKEKIRDQWYNLSVLSLSGNK